MEKRPPIQVFIVFHQVCLGRVCQSSHGIFPGGPGIFHWQTKIPSRNRYLSKTFLPRDTPGYGKEGATERFSGMKMGAYVSRVLGFTPNFRNFVQISEISITGPDNVTPFHPW